MDATRLAGARVLGPDLGDKARIKGDGLGQRHGVIARTLHPQVPPRVEYALSPLGIALLPLLQQMHDLALSHAELLAQSGDGPDSPAIEPG
ncbi:hypothetical protein GWQ27_17285 [Aeromonas sp. 5HA1]|nr:hypothetical protein [Aeromonas sp. 5HA1]